MEAMMVEAGTAVVEHEADESELKEAQQHWIAELDLVEREYAAWYKYGDKLLNNYRGCRAEDQGLQFNVYQQSRYNILTSNTQTLQPALLNRQPVPVVERRYRDADPVGRVASEVLQRCVSYCLTEYNFMDTLRACRDDYLLPGRGTAWVRYVPHFRAIKPKIWLRERPNVQFEGLQITETVHREMEPHILGYDPMEAEEHAKEEQGEAPEGLDPADTFGLDGSIAHEADEQFGGKRYQRMDDMSDVDEDAEIFFDEETGKPYIDGEEYQEVVYEEVVCDYVFWKDFLCSLSRRWEEVRWVARRAFMTKDEIKERFGCERTADIQFAYRENNGKESVTDEDTDNFIKRACVYEIWDKTSGKVYWIARGTDRPLDIKQDPLKLHNFFPCPKPMLSIVTNDSLIPVPFFWIYQDQARALDRLTNKIDKLTQALRIAGIYDAQAEGIARVFEEGAEAQLIPVADWASIAGRGGAAGAISFIPFREIAEVMNDLIVSRETVKKDMYEITGIADIIRGASAASETATAQRIKGQFATLRLGDMQNEVQRFARDLIAIMGEVIAEQFTPETIALISGNNAMQDPMMMQQFNAAIDLLRDDGLRTFKIDIETDSTIAADDTQEKQDRTEFLTAMGSFLEKALPVATQVPELASFLGEAMMFGMRGFRASRQLETSFEQAMKQIQQRQQQQMQQPPQQAQEAQPSPDQMAKIQLQAQKNQIDQGWLQHETQRTAAEMALRKRELDHRQALDVAKLQQAQQRPMLNF